MEETRPADRVLDKVDSRGRKATINEGITSTRKRDLSAIFKGVLLSKEITQSILADVVELSYGSTS